ncbi:MAG: galactosyldiacylglycerol synthase [Ardenticatenales bacterium]|nr:galactosyldiacylglycerol synthase [Ardenticatenales bacterium]
MIQLTDKETGADLGTITEEQLQLLKGELEEESSEDRDYYINGVTLEMFEEHGMEAGLVAQLKQALGDREEMEIRWVHV